MKSIVDDYADINAKLSQLEAEKPEVKADDAVPDVSSIYGIPFAPTDWTNVVYGGDDTAPSEYVCWAPIEYSVGVFKRGIKRTES